MESAAETPVLDTDLTPPSLEQWRGLVDRVLDRSGSLDRAGLDAAFRRRLTTTTPDGVRLQPLYTAADERPQEPTPGARPYTRGATPSGAVIGGWDVRAHHGDPDAAATAAAILADLQGGATSLWLTVGSQGIAIDDLPTVLEPVLLDLAAVVLDAGDEGVDAAHALRDLWTARGLADDAVSGNLGLDPIGIAARTGQHPDLIPSIGLALATAERHPNVRSFVVDGRVLHEAGATDAQELGGAIAIGTEYLRELVAQGLPVDLALRQIEFRLVATADQFATIAKFRAARRLWARVAEVAGASQDGIAGAGAMRQHAVTSWSMTSRRDPWVNLLRGTVAAFAAGVAGAHSVTVLPFDVALGLPDVFARRLARNTQALLIEEAGLARVIDPAGGSWFVESFTDELATSAWTWFQQLEADGGFIAALSSGRVAADVAASATARADRIAHRADPLTGVSEFPDVHEEPLVRRPAPTPPDGGLPRKRYAEPFEALRDRADAAMAAGRTPQVLLAALGPVSAFTARATYAKSFYEVGGFHTEVIEFNPITDDAVSLFAAATGEGASAAVCLCSSDAVYSKQAVDAVNALTAAGIQSIHMAGKGGADTELLKSAGLTAFIHAGSDVLDILERTMHDLAVTR